MQTTTQRKGPRWSGGFRFELSDNLLVVDQLARFILHTADRVLSLAFSLVELAFGFCLGVAGHFTDAFLDLAFKVFAGAFNAIFIHVRSPSVTHHGIPRSDWSLDGKYNVIRFKNGSTIDLLDVAYKPTDPDDERFGSYEFNGGFGEEVGEWHFKAFDVLKSRIGRHRIMRDGVDITPHPKFGMSCNPTKNWPYRVFYKPFKEGTLPS
jgi:hypothetical protein